MSSQVLPTKVVAAGMLFRSRDGRVLLVQPTYKPTWEIPGGVVEENEPPAAAAAREVAEELGLAVRPGALLVVDHSPARPDRPVDLIAFVFDGGTLTQEQLAAVVLQESEIASFRFVTLPEAEALLSPILFRRVAACAGATSPRYLENGHQPQW
jgi:8-oxo-dGTP diphosphatase